MVLLIATIFVAGLLRSPEFTAQAAVDIARSPQQVFTFLINGQNLPQWSPAIEKVEKLSDQPLRFRVTSQGASNDIEYFDLQPPRSFASRTAMPAMGVSGVWRIQIEPSTIGSRVVSTVNMRIDSAAWRALAQFMDANAEERKTLEALKQFLEK